MRIELCGICLVFATIASAGSHGAAPEGRDGRLASPKAHQAGSGLIAYERRVGNGPKEIFLMGADGSNQRHLATGCCFDWSPDGRAIAFVRDGIYVINVDGSGLRRLAELSADDRLYTELDWAPDGRRIAFSRVDNRSIFLVNADGTGMSRLTTPPGKAWDHGPQWSPNGRMVVFERFLTERGHTGADIFVIDADGTTERRLTRDLGHESPSWSPGGRMIAFQGWSGRDYDIYVMGADGSKLRNVSLTPRTDERLPNWSPRGTRILFQSGRGIHSVRPDGRRHRKIAVGSDPMWSDNSIVFARLDANNWDIYVMTAAGRNQRSLTNTPRPTQERGPVRSPT